MKIAVMGILAQPISENALGGTEIFTANLVNELSKRGHAVTLYATKDSQVDARVEGVLSSSFFCDDIKPSTMTRRAIAMHIDMFMDFLKVQNNFDFLHISMAEWYALLPLLKLLEIPYCITIHSKILDDKTLEVLAEKYPETRLVFVSNEQKKNFPNFKNSVVIHNGIDLEKYDFHLEPEDYISWLGRITENKGAGFLPRVAQKLPHDVKFGGGVGDENFFNAEIKPHLTLKNLQYLGPLDLKQKNQLFKNAKVMLNPTCCDEAFGLVVAEANACGTPVIAFNRGSMSELIEDGVNGFLVNQNDLEALILATENVYKMPAQEYQLLRKNSRKHTEDFFSLKKMVDSYEKIYCE